ncbi:helix-turn-helix transcriptional regulator [Burkholderia cenocepacia]|uniref:DNA-binding protein n=1 Tax=Burkholderia cenocepacia TaxID=95486 RepID=A0A1V2VUM1_9BURK|nr:DNA-binding protein [Burkholderia cenocepacia]ONU48822.1 hypothetical protein A8E66_04405 [Burkholderia cenocepacia]ONU51764.1 hypothetical protein A8E62_26430 [Burkholderia cenocepacia]ONU53488.1 hypothetical protein A8E68_37315 [Burkholderia cenocepacia]ONU66360.1 hypothetical protein A8E67_07530 [Burkholderia cenocepacia]ONU71909.1 hypothetical protein A8E63_40000 [Burkholderia cenocepacia]
MPTDFDSLSDAQLINENLLSEWLDQPTATLQKWRVTGKGPKYVKFKNRSVRYQVGTIRRWLDEQTVAHTAEANVKKIIRNLN